MQDSRELKAGQRAHPLALSGYRSTRQFPIEERYGITAQIRRSCISVGANIAEGWGRKGKSELIHFPHIALGSAKEVQYLLLLARDLELLPPANHLTLEGLVVGVQKMLVSLIKKVEGRIC